MHSRNVTGARRYLSILHKLPCDWRRYGPHGSIRFRLLNYFLVLPFAGIDHIVPSAIRFSTTGLDSPKDTHIVSFLLLNGHEDAAISQSDRLPAQKMVAELSTVWIEVKMC